jgi:hypothetical protein
MPVTALNVTTWRTDREAMAIYLLILYNNSNNNIKKTFLLRYISEDEKVSTACHRSFTNILLLMRYTAATLHD